MKNRHDRNNLLLTTIIGVLFITYVTLLCSSCGSFDKKSDPVFTKYKQTFEKITGHNLSGLPIIFGDSDGRFPWQADASADTIGMCRTTQVGDGKWHDKYITIDREAWDAMAESSKEHIIFHEAIHCELEMEDHVNQLVEYRGWELPHLMHEAMDDDLDISVEFYRNQLKEYSL